MNDDCLYTIFEIIPNSDPCKLGRPNKITVYCPSKLVYKCVFPVAFFLHKFEVQPCLASNRSCPQNSNGRRATLARWPSAQIRVTLLEPQMDNTCLAMTYGAGLRLKLLPRLLPREQHDPNLRLPPLDIPFDVQEDPSDILPTTSHDNASAVSFYQHSHPVCPAPSPPAYIPAHGTKEPLRRTNFDLSVNEAIGVSEDVDIRKLNFKERKWEKWRKGTVVNKWQQLCFVGHEFSCFEVQLTAYSETQVPCFCYVFSFAGELCTSPSPLPTTTAEEALAKIETFRTVFALTFLCGPRKSKFWVPAKVTSSLFHSPLIVVYHPGHCPPHLHVGELFQSVPATFCPWLESMHPSGKCTCKYVTVERAYPYTTASATYLRNQGDSVITAIPFA